MILKSKTIDDSLQPVTLILSICLFYILVSGCKERKSEVHDYPVTPVPFMNVKVTDDFWSERMLMNNDVTIPLAFKKAEETGRIDNFRVAGHSKEGGFCSKYPFDDSDVYKNIEAASYSLQLYPDPRLHAYLDSLINLIAASQEADGYIYTNRTIDPENTHEMAGKERWEKVEEGSHELYNAGHLYEAAAAHYQATGDHTLLNVALKNANLIDSLFGWGKIEKAPGHQEIEIGLVKLYRITGERKYLDLARFFIDVRGPGGDEYNQMHRKAVEQDVAVGHAVRAQYMYAAMADIAALTGEISYLEAIDNLWSDVVSSKTYVTGGIGSMSSNEGFGAPYDLPNMEAYCETCAAIANALWNYRMFLLHGESKYFDVFEKVLYNGLLSGISLNGKEFFYANPLASNGQFARKPWYGCACCPVNITRFLPSLPGYVYAVKGDKLFVNLFIGNEAGIDIAGHQIKLSQTTEYPWEGKIKFIFSLSGPLVFEMKVRVPGWAGNLAFPTDLYYFPVAMENEAAFVLNGKRISMTENSGYASLERKWSDGDELVVNFPMVPRRGKANNLVGADKGQVALQRGPVIYCLEGIDQKFHNMPELALTDTSTLYYDYRNDLLNGVGTITGNLSVTTKEYTGHNGVLRGKFLAIPYFAWANRGKGEMEIWVPETVQANSQ